MITDTRSHILAISAVTLVTHDMVTAVRFYKALGFTVKYGGESASFTSFAFGTHYLNLASGGKKCQPHLWGRIIFYVDDVDAFYRNVLTQGYSTDTQPRDAEWDERYFHLTDPDGNELSFAAPLTRTGPDDGNQRQEHDE